MATTTFDGIDAVRAAVGTHLGFSDWTEITSGITAGAEVVLADVNAPLPGSATATNGTTGTNTTNRFGGFGAEIRCR